MILNGKLWFLFSRAERLSFFFTEKPKMAYRLRAPVLIAVIESRFYSNEMKNIHSLTNIYPVAFVIILLWDGINHANALNV